MITRRAVMMQASAAALVPQAGLGQSRLAAQIASLGRPLRILVPNGSQANLAPVLRSFDKTYGCRAELIVTDLDNINATLAIEALTREHEIDVALPATFGLPDLAEGGAIRPVDDLGVGGDMTGNETGSLYQTGDFFDGKRWGYQTDGDIYMMFYHAGMLGDARQRESYADRFGTPLETPLDWPTLDRHLSFFHDPDAGRFGGCLFRTEIYAAWEWVARFHAKGIWLFSPGMEPQINGEAGVTALEEMIASAAFLTGTDFGLFANWARYKRGDVYANIGWGGTQKALNAAGSHMRGRVVPARLPCGQHEGEHIAISYFNWGWSYVVTRHSAAPELAHLFSRHAVSPSVSTAAVAEADGFFDPFREDHYADPKIAEVYGAAFLKEHETAMRNAMPDLYLARRNEYFEELSYWLGLALSNEVAPQTALDRVADAWRLITARVGHARQEAKWRELRAAYPAALQAYLRDL